MLVLLATATFCLISSTLANELKLTILHTNDVHSRFLEIDQYGGICSDSDIEENKCFGGFARLHYKVNEIRKSHPNVLYLSGGDYFQGTVWYTLYKWKVVANFVDQLNHTAMSFGNHEFDDNIDKLVPFLDAIHFPVICSNINDSAEPTIQGKYKKSVVVEVEGNKIGLIGYVTTETRDLSFPGKLEFLDEVESIRKEANLLDAQGVKIIIAVGHAGYDVDLKIAKKVELVDFVVGGHTNTFLYTGTPPHIDEPLAEYPTIVTQISGKKVPVVQAYAFGKYLGYINVSFDENGNAKSWKGNPILLDGSVPQDAEMKAELTEWAKNISSEMKNEVGRTRVLLEGRAIECRRYECNLGNLIADAMVRMNQKFGDEEGWNDISMALMNSGGIRSSISETNNGTITFENVLTVLPFQNTVDLIEIKGKFLRQAFEFSVENYDPNGLHLPGKFLQVSGIRVVYDINKPNGQRVQKLDVLCTNCRIPKYGPINDTETYKVAVPTFMAVGGDGYKVIKENIEAYHISGILDSDVLLQYLESQDPVVQGLEDRIIFTSQNSTGCDCAKGAAAISKSQMSQFNLLFLLLLIYVNL